MNKGRMLGVLLSYIATFGGIWLFVWKYFKQRFA